MLITVILIKNLHFFGEAAADKNFNKAFFNGLLISVDPRVDISFVHRKIDQSITSPIMEMHLQKIHIQQMKMVFMRVSPSGLLLAWRFDAYGDIYKFPWLKYLVDAPSHGKDFLAQMTYTPNRQLEVYTRYRNETKQSNQPDNTTCYELSCITCHDKIGEHRSVIK